MKKQQTTFKTLEIERDKLYVSKQNQPRLKEIIKKLDYLYYGIK